MRNCSSHAMSLLLALLFCTWVSQAQTELPGNPTCGDSDIPDCNVGIKIDPPNPGTYYFVPDPGSVVFTCVPTGYQDPANSITITTYGSYFDFTSTVPIEFMIVKGGPNANLYTFDPPVYSGTGLHAPINPSNGEPYGLSHIEFCLQYSLDVQKDAQTTYTRTWEWEIEKSVNPAVWQLINGDQGTSDWMVEVTKTGHTDSDWAVEGAITVSNNTPFDAMIESVSDIVSGGFPASCNCGVSFPYTLGAGDVLVCDYATNLPDATQRVNTATVTTSAASMVDGGEATADVIFGAPTTIVNDEITVNDTNGESWTTDQSDSWTYPQTFDCVGCGSFPCEGNMYENTATIVETGQSDDAYVVVNCYELTVSKTAESFYTRTWNWMIEKTADPTLLQLINGDQGASNWTVEVTKTGFTDSDWAVSGQILIENTTPFDALITDISDVLPGASNLMLGCNTPFTVAAGDTYMCTYMADLPDAATRTNTVTVTSDFDGFVKANTATADVIFGDPTTVVNDEITVEDERSPGAPWTTSSSSSWTYPETFDCEDCGGSFPCENTYYNTATIVETGQSDDAFVEVECYELTLTKTAVPAYTRTWNWTIDKSVDPAIWNIFNGDQVTSDWTIEVTKTGFTDSDWAVSGQILIENTTPFDALITDISDVLPGASNLMLGCNTPFTVAAGDTYMCTYMADLPDAATRTNTVTVTSDFDGFVKANQAQADVIFGEPTSVVNDEITVEDERSPGAPWTTSSSSSWTYPETFNCEGCGGSFPCENTYYNTATIVETGAHASASVQVNCDVLGLMTANTPTFNRYCDWTIEKTGSASDLTLSTGQIFNVSYDVVVEATYVDGDWVATCYVEITNHSLTIPAALTDVSLVINPGGYTTASFSDIVIEPGNTFTCNFEPVMLPDNLPRTVIATATQQNFNYYSDGTFSPAGTTDYAASAPVIFSSIPNDMIDECIDVDDDQFGFLGTVCAPDQQTWTFTYQLDVGPYDECGLYAFVNTASCLSNDNGHPSSNFWEIAIDIPCGGCTLTPGYWKTHSTYGPAPYDDTWAQIGEDSPFFLSGQSYFDALWTPPAGNVYYILAPAYIAAQLNELNDADFTAAQDAFDAATILFETTTPEEADDLKGQAKKAWTDLASILDEYNNGIIGPGHCDEEEDGGTSGSNFGTAETELQTDELQLQVYPNPYAEVVNFNIQIPYTTNVTLEIYNLNGQLMSVPYQATQYSGQLDVQVDLSDTGKGVFIYRLRTDRETVSGKLMPLY